jgi:hypothetical protein
MATPKQSPKTKGLRSNTRAHSRQELNNMLLADMAEAWELYGIVALKEMALAEPSQFVKTFSALLPKQVEVDVTENMNEEQLVTRIRELAANLGLEADLSLLNPPRTGETAH